MTFMMYETQNGNLQNTGKKFSLAGCEQGLIHKAWERLSSKERYNHGWHMSANDLINIFNEATDSTESHLPKRLIIDYAPKRMEAISLIEILDIYAYTYDTKREGIWTPLMLRLRDVFVERFHQPLTPEQKSGKIACFTEKPTDDEVYIEFLYLKDDWGWPGGGPTNAAFLKKMH